MNERSAKRLNKKARKIGTMILEMGKNDKNIIRTTIILKRERNKREKSKSAAAKVRNA